MEIDGIPLTGKLSATGAKADLMNDAIEIKWNVINKEGNGKNMAGNYQQFQNRWQGRL